MYIIQKASGLDTENQATKGKQPARSSRRLDWLEKFCFQARSKKRVFLIKAHESVTKVYFRPFSCESESQ